MLVGVFGLIGSGKSLLLADIAEKAIQGKKIYRGGFGAFNKYDRVYTNFPCCGAYKLDFDKLGEELFEDACIIIDEIQLFADSRNYKNFSDSLKDFLSLSRKYKCDIIYASQSYDHCDKRIRDLTERFYYVSRGICGYMKIQRITTFFTVENGSIKEGYQLEPPISSLYLRYKKLYGKVDTNYKIKAFNLSENTAEYWDNVYHYDFPSLLWA